jgi:O-methyltransferase involved in polyketide biosynthesis
MTEMVLKDVAKTAVWTLRARAEEHLQPHALFRDEKAIEWIQRIPWPEELDEWYSDYAQTGIAIRTRVFDDLVREHIQRLDRPMVVELGCGLSSRYHRIGEGYSLWLDFDLPDVIQARRTLAPETETHRNLAGSLLDYAWMDLVRQEMNGDLILIAEGLLMYFDLQQVQALLQEMQRQFPGALLIFDTQGEKAKKMNERFTKRVNAALKWVVKNPAGLQGLPLELLSVSSLFGHFPRRLGLARLLYWVPAMRNINLFVESRLPET